MSKLQVPGKTRVPERPTYESLLSEHEEDNLGGWCCPLARDTNGEQHKMGCYVRYKKPRCCEHGYAHDTLGCMVEGCPCNPDTK